MAVENRGPVVVGITVFTLALSCIVISARVITRTLINPQFGMDDVLIVMTLCIFIAFTTSELVAVHYGFGKPLAELSLANTPLALRASIIAEVFALWTYPTGKAAVAYLLMRLFPGKILRWILWSFVAVNAFLFYLNGIFILVHCSPIDSQWNLSVKPTSCLNTTLYVVWGYVSGSVGAATDFAFAIVPWFYIARLRMSFRQKLAIGASLSLGLVPFICSILKIQYLTSYGADGDPSYSTVDLVVAGEAELCAINLAACIPTLLPLYQWCRGKRRQSTTDPYRAPTQGRATPNLNLKRAPAHLKLTPTEILLRSIDRDSDYMVQLPSQSNSVKDRGEAASQEGQMDNITSDHV